MIKKLCVLLTLILFCGAKTGVTADNTLTWLEADAPPFYIFDGPYKGQGYQTLATDQLEKELSHYEHKHAEANMSRHYELFRSKAQVCALALYKKPEREEIAHFSIPSFITLPGVLVVSREKYEEFGGVNTVSLKKLLQEGEMVFGFNKKRSFGPAVDNLFAEYGTKDNLFEYEGQELSLNFFEMLERGRVDAFLGLPEEIVYQAERLGLKDNIMTLSIDENMQNKDGWVTYAACSKSEWGKKAIEDINKALIKLRPTEEYRAAYERWLDESSMEVYRKAYADVFAHAVE